MICENLEINFANFLAIDLCWDQAVVIKSESLEEERFVKQNIVLVYPYNLQEGAESWICETAGWSPRQPEEGRGKGNQEVSLVERETHWAAEGQSLERKLFTWWEPQGSRSWLQEPERHFWHGTRRGTQTVKGQEEQLGSEKHSRQLWGVGKEIHKI